MSTTIQCRDIIASHAIKRAYQQIDRLKSLQTKKERNEFRCRECLLPAASLFKYQDKLLYKITAAAGVQVIMCTHNSEQWIQRCLDSIELAMEGKNWILIIADDDSKDNTFSIVKKHMTHARYYIYEKFPKAASAGQAKNRAFLLGKAFRALFPWICPMDDDDEMHPLKIDFLMSRALQYNQVFVVGDHLIVDQRTGAAEKTTLLPATAAVAPGKFEFGPWAVLFHHSLIPADDQLWRSDMLSYEDADRFWRWYVSGVPFAPYDGQVVHIHYLQDKSVSMGDYNDARSAVALGFKEYLRTKQDNPVKRESTLESFCTIADRNIAGEFLITVKSIRLFHTQPLYVICDAFIEQLIREYGFRDIIAVRGTDPADLEKTRIAHFPGGYDGIWEFPVFHFNPALLIKKMDIMQLAMDNHRNTLLLDSDMIFVAPLQHRFINALVLSPEYSDWVHQDYDFLNDHACKKPQCHKVFGLYNAGFLYAGDKNFPAWWREKFLTDSKFLEQEALNRVSTDYAYDLFPITSNYGIWNLWPLFSNPWFRNKYSRVIERINGFLAPENDILVTLKSFPARIISRELGFQSDYGIWLNGCPMQSFHIHQLLKSQIKEVQLRREILCMIFHYLLSVSRQKEHEELLLFIQEMTARTLPGN